MNAKLLTKSMRFAVACFFLSMIVLTSSVAGEGAKVKTWGQTLAEKASQPTQKQDILKIGPHLKKTYESYSAAVKQGLEQTVLKMKMEREIEKMLRPEVLIPAFMSEWSKLDVNARAMDVFPSRSASTYGGGISGTVTVEGALPSQPVTVIAFDEHGYFAGKNAAQDTKGYSFSISNLKNGDYYLITSSTHYVDEMYDDVNAPLSSRKAWREAKKITVRNDVYTEFIAVDLQKGAIVKGRIFSKDGMSPIADQTVTFEFTRPDDIEVLFEQTVPTTNGYYEVVVPVTGSLKMAASLPNFAKTWYPDKIDWSEGTIVNIPDITSTINEINFSMQPDESGLAVGQISGIIKGKGQFIGAFLGLAFAFDLSDSSLAGFGYGLLGGYKITDLPPGQYLVYGNDYIGELVGFPNYLGAFYPNSQTPGGATPVTVAAGMETSNINFDLEKGGSITGTVANSLGQKLDSLMVLVLHADILYIADDPFLTGLQIGLAVTDKDGVYKVEGLPEGNYVVRTLSDFMLNFVKLNLDTGKHAGRVVDQYYGGVHNLLRFDEATPVQVQGANETAGVDLNLEYAKYITGEVVDAVSSEPVSDVLLVALEAESGYPFLSIGGVLNELSKVSLQEALILGPLADGEYKILALTGLSGSNDYLSEFFDGARNFDEAKILQVQGSNIENVKITLDRGATVQGFVDLSSGYRAGADTLDGFPVFVFKADDGTLASYDFVQFNGGWRVNRLLPGSYKILVLPTVEPFAATYYGGGDTFDDPSSQSLDLNYGDVMACNFQLEQATGAIGGTIRKSATQSELPYVMVVAYDGTGHPSGLGVAGIDLLTGNTTGSPGSYVIGGIRDGQYFLRTYALATNMALMDQLAGLLDMLEGFDLTSLLNPDLFSMFDISVSIFKDQWYQNTEAVIELDLNDLLFKVSAYGFPSEYDNSLLPFYLPLPAYEAVPYSATPVAVSGGGPTLGKDFNLEAGTLGDIFKTDVEIVAQEESTPERFSVKGNYPNPFNPQTTLVFTLPQAIQVSVDIYDIRGRHINTLLARRLTPGEHHLLWQGVDKNGIAVPSGIYFAQISAGRTHRVVKMSVVK